ncbi:MAG: AAA family ATPase [Halomonas sp.]|uniref:KGGVGR-motif variant AAA ATPase n=1 Tax=Halomonas sp. TaxID=1486246 RepID=UPI002ACEB7C2|nr:AAA family ATPase [Halomonas sp.]MDZ7854175.1 AAA family ATPase [Halomonas sp.]
MNNQKETVLFHNALQRAEELTLRWRNKLPDEITLVRDLRGRIRPVLRGRRDQIDTTALDGYSRALSESLGRYGFPPQRALLFEDELAEPDAVLAERRQLGDEPESEGLYLLDRQVIGQDWMRDSLARITTNPRVTFYGIKGGVGRSTALVNWAWHLAEQGKRVLVFDLDLESPGVSSTLLPEQHRPDFGIVDWFVEDGVGQADIIEPELVGISPLAQELAGEVMVVPAYGSKTGGYLPKLARCYAEFSGSQPMSWAERLNRLVEVLERHHAPDLVILDSRAGLHDIAAVLVTRMDADTLLFGIDSTQTWAGYRMLFEHWNRHPNVEAFRHRLQVVASLVPETGRDEYLRRFREHAWDVFRDQLYDQAEPDDLEAFSFDLHDEAAPHAPWPIFWHRALQEFDPAKGGIDARTAQESLGRFMEAVDQWVIAAIGEERT